VPTPRPRRISDFKPLLSNLAQTSHYIVELGAPPKQLATYLEKRGVDSRFISGDAGILCYSVSLPHAAIATAAVSGNYTGIHEKIAHSRIPTPIGMEFYVDKDYKILKFFEHWAEFIASGSHNTIDSPVGAISQGEDSYFVRMQYPEYYRMQSTKITKFERDHNPTRNLEYTFFDMFPQSVSIAPVSYDASRTLTASVTFEYTRYVCGPITKLSEKKGESNNQENNIPTDKLYYNSKVAPLNLDEAYRNKANANTYQFDSKDLKADYWSGGFGVSSTPSPNTTQNQAQSSSNK
jgi:hypothetical protein